MTAITLPAASTASFTTRTLLAGAVVGGPLWAAVSLTQAATRDGYDITRHPLSVLSTGSLGWLQITNFVVAGVLLMAGATGVRQALRGTPGGVWGPRLIRVAGAGMVAAGLLVMDPADGFPVGTPAGMPPTMSWHSYGHMAAGSVTFTTLIAACYVLARHFAKTGRRGSAVAAVVSGTALLAGNGWAGSGGTAGSLTLAVGAITALIFIAVTAARLRAV
jgi:hypothetical protein